MRLSFFALALLLSACGTKSPPKSSTAATEVSPIEGGLRVELAQAGWATVYIDGVAQSLTAPGTFDLPTGTYVIRVENLAAGYGHTETVDVVHGQSLLLTVPGI